MNGSMITINNREQSESGIREKNKRYQKHSDKFDLYSLKTGDAADCDKCHLRESALCGSLTDKEFKYIPLRISSLNYNRSETIYREGKKDAFIYIIRSGLVKQELTLPDGNLKVVRLLTKGDIIGLETLINKPYHHTATALNNCEVCKMPAALFLSMRTHYAPLNYNLMLSYDKAISDAHEWLAKLNTGPARQRVSHFIDFLVSKSESAPEFIMPSRDDISSILGLTRETICRVIADLRRDGVIIFFGDGVYEKNLNNTQ